MLPTIEIFGKPLNLYVFFNALSVLIGLVVMLVITIIFARKINPIVSGVDYKKARKKYTRSTMISFLLSYAFLYMGTQLIGKIKFKDMNMEGVAFIGGVLLFIPIFALLSYHLPKNGDTLSQLERTFPSLSLMQAFNRFACTAAGCCYGIPFKFGVLFPRGSQAALKYGVQTRIFPTAPFEASVMLICFIIILIRMEKNKDTLHLFPIFFGMVGLINQFLMGDVRGIMILKIFDVQQIGYIILIFIGIFFYFYRNRHLFKRKAIK